MTRYVMRNDDGETIYKGTVRPARTWRDKRISEAWRDGGKDGGMLIFIGGLTFLTLWLFWLPWWFALPLALLVAQLVTRGLRASERRRELAARFAAATAPTLEAKIADVRLHVEAELPYVNGDTGEIWPVEQSRTWLAEQEKAGKAEAGRKEIQRRIRRLGEEIGEVVGARWLDPVARRTKVQHLRDRIAVLERQLTDPDTTVLPEPKEVTGRVHFTDPARSGHFKLPDDHDRAASQRWRDDHTRPATDADWQRTRRHTTTTVPASIRAKDDMPADARVLEHWATFPRGVCGAGSFTLLIPNGLGVTLEDVPRDFPSNNSWGHHTVIFYDAAPGWHEFAYNADTEVIETAEFLEPIKVVQRPGFSVVYDDRAKARANERQVLAEAGYTAHRPIRVISDDITTLGVQRAHGAIDNRTADSLYRDLSAEYRAAQAAAAEHDHTASPEES